MASSANAKAMYIPCDAVEKAIQEGGRFDAWYADGSVAMSFESEDWTKEKSIVTIYSRMGYVNGRIKPEPSLLFYYLRIERWEYELHTKLIGKEYFVDGMLWHVMGGLQNCPIRIMRETVDKKNKTAGAPKEDAVIKRIENFKNRCDVYEVRVKDISKLRIAAATVVGMMIKDAHKGLSEGFDDEDAGRLKKAKYRLTGNKGLTYEEVMAGERFRH